MLYIKLNTYLLLSSYETNIRLNEIPPNSSGKWDHNQRNG